MKMQARDTGPLKPSRPPLSTTPYRAASSDAPRGGGGLGLGCGLGRAETCGGGKCVSSGGGGGIAGREHGSMRDDRTVIPF